MNETLISKLWSARQLIPPCVPPVWANGGHLQTIWGHLLPSPRIPRGDDIHIPLNRESERIHSTYLRGTSDLVVYLFHGLGGSAEGSYMERTALMASSLGHHVFLNNHRGCGKGVGLATEPYHSGRADDLSRVVAFGKKMLPNHRHLAIGFSLSANATLLLAAGFRSETQPDYAIAVNAPIDLDHVSRKLQQGLNRIYDKRFTLDMRDYIKANRPQDLGDFSRVKDLRDVDQYYTAPFGGFKDRDDYYRTCSSLQFLPKINIPTVVLTAEDDPFVTIEDYRKAVFSESCVVHIEKHGGHLGYLTRKGLTYSRWLDQALETYLRILG